MNVVHILDNLDRGGAQTMLRSLVAGLSARGYQQHIICLNETFNTQVLNSMRQAGATVDVVGKLRLYVLIGFWHIVRELRRRKPDVVHTQLPWGDLIGRTAARIAGTSPIVSTITSRYDDKPHIQLILDRLTTPWVERIAFVSSDIVEFSIKNEGVRPEQVQCIPNGVEPDNTDRTAAAASLRRRFGGGAQTIIGMVARLHPQKAHADLLAAFAKLPSTDVRLWIIGDGPELARLTALAQHFGIADRVLFAGDQDNVRDWLTAIDIFAHPSYFEGLPVAVIEAMAAAKPVIATSVDGLCSLIDSGVHGWLVPPGDPNALVDAIRYVMDHPEHATCVARAGAERVRTEFGVERVVEDYDKLFTSVTATRTGSRASVN